MGSNVISHDSDSVDTGRFDIVRPLGEGAAGRVWLASERTTGELFALKQLRRMDPKTVLRLKREFRALADLDHPSLVKLYDLVHERDGFLLVMEYVAGVDLDTHVTHVTRTGVDYLSLADTFLELAIGVQALHHAGILHRDLKPTNVLVAEDRVVLLDFGLALELGEQSPKITAEGTIAGTPAYMAPEQAANEALSEATDWYAFGVMLYEAVCGAAPIRARNVLELLQRKLASDFESLPPDSGLPDELRGLCTRLLTRVPAQRPSGDEVVATLAALAARPDARQSLPKHLRIGEPDQFVGRAAELERLTAAVKRAERGSVVVHLRGSSGSGKSALVERFVSDLQTTANTQSPVLVLRSRCYERESMPFKALDGVVDAIVRHLSALPDLEVAYALPSELAELAQVFPAFERHSAIRRLLTQNKPTGDAAQIRQRAEYALRELMTRIGKHSLPVIVIDDLHWGDLDSAHVIVDWLHQPILPLLLILSYRSEEAVTSPGLQVILEAVRPLPPSAAKEVWLDLSPLSDEDVRELCRGHDTRRAMPEDLIARIAREARGSPFLAQQLTALAHARLARGERDMGALSLGDLIAQAGELLVPPARELLDVLAIAGRPLSPSVAVALAGITQDGRKHIHRLQRLHLVRMRDVAAERRLEIYHDRVRDAVRNALSAERRVHLHRRLLRQLESNESTDADWLHLLALGAGDREAALRYGRKAAEHAETSLAFEGAAELYRTCLTLCDDPAEATELWVRLASSLARCKHGVRAAEAYVRATEHMSNERAVPLLRLAASHFIRSGRFAEGDVLVQKVLRGLHLDVPTSTPALIASIAWELTRRGLSGERFDANSGPGTAEARYHGQLYVALAIETLMYAPVRAVLFQARALRCAYASGDPALLASALCLTATMSCISGTARSARRAESMIARAAALTEHLPGRNVRCEFELYWARTVSSMMLGRPTAVIDAGYKASAIYESEHDLGEQGEYYYMFAIHAARLGALANLGQYKTVSVELEDIRSTARASDNRTALLLLTFPTTMAEQMLESCMHSRQRLQGEREQLPAGEFSVLHLQHLLATLRAACVTGDFKWATPIVKQDWPRYLQSQTYRSAYMAYAAHTMHARLVLNQYARERSGDPARLVSDDLHGLARLPRSSFTTGSLCRHRARLAGFRGARELAISLLRESVEAFGAAGFRDECEFDRYALGAVLGGDEGARLRAASLAELTALGCNDPVANVRGYYPELIPPTV